MIQIGTVIQGYKVYGICDKYCIARNISPRTAGSWVVWTIDNNQKGVHTGRYFSNQMDAEWEFASLAFQWFQDNVSINFTAETVD